MKTMELLAHLRPLCQGRWLDIFSSLCPGMFDEAISKIGKHVDCPFHGGRDFRFTKKASQKGGSTLSTGVAMCTCGPKSGGFPDGFEVLKHALPGVSFREILNRIDSFLGGSIIAAETKPVAPRIKEKEADDADSINKSNRALWGRGGEFFPRDYTYYVARGIHPEALLDLKCVRTIDRNPYYEEQKDGSYKKVAEYPTILAAMQNARDELVAVHRTMLSYDKRSKAPLLDNKKLTRTVNASGAAIRLHNARGADTLGIAEGIETALGVRTMLLGGRWPQWGPFPVWATYCKANIESFEIPPWLLVTLKRLVIFADNDKPKSERGQKGPLGPGLCSAIMLRNRLAEEYPDLEVIIVLPQYQGDDMLDELLRFYL